MRKVKKLEIDFGPPEGSWSAKLYDDGTYGISGKPFPSESQAYAFRRVITAINRLANMPFEEIESFAEGK